MKVGNGAAAVRGRKLLDQRMALERGYDYREFKRIIARRMKIINKGLRRKGSIEELKAIAAASDVPVTKCPPHTHSIWPKLTPEQLRLRGS